MPSVSEIFDSIGTAYEAAFEGLPTQAASLKWLLSQLEACGTSTAKIVDLGCGSGRPVCSMLADSGHDVLGIDISPVMITAARERVPNANFEQKDFRNLDFPDNSFDAVTAYFSMIACISQQEIRDLIVAIFQLLKPGGFFVLASVPIQTENLSITVMGVPVVMSSLGREEMIEWIRHVGFHIDHEAISYFTPKGAEAGLCKPEDVWEETHIFIYAKKPMR